MSMDDVDFRESILRLIRKSAPVDYNSESLQGPSNYLEYRTKFLECRKQFEQPPPQVERKLFLPHWVRSKYNTDIPITYKKRGNIITDVRINLFKNGDGNNREIGNRMISNKPGVTGSAETLPNKHSGSNGRCKLADRLRLQSVNEEKSNSLGIEAASYSIDGNLLAASDERVQRRMDRHSKSIRSIKRVQSLKIIEERISSMSFEIKSTLASNRIVDTLKKDPIILTSDSVIPRKPTVYGPIVRKAIELKKYDHIITNIISNKK